MVALVVMAAALTSGDRIRGFAPGVLVTVSMLTSATLWINVATCCCTHDYLLGGGGGSGLFGGAVGAGVGFVGFLGGREGVLGVGMIRA